MEVRYLALVDLRNEFDREGTGGFAVGKLWVATRAGPGSRAREDLWPKVMLPRPLWGYRAVTCRAWVPSNTPSDQVRSTCPVASVVVTFVPGTFTRAYSREGAPARELAS